LIYTSIKTVPSIFVSANRIKIVTGVFFPLSDELITFTHVFRINFISYKNFINNITNNNIFVEIMEDK